MTIHSASTASPPNMYLQPKCFIRGEASNGPMTIPAPEEANKMDWAYVLFSTINVVATVFEQDAGYPECPTPAINRQRSINVSNDPVKPKMMANTPINDIESINTFFEPILSFSRPARI